MTWPTALEASLYADLARSDLSTFVRKVYGVERNPKGTWWDPLVHQPLCVWLQHELISWLERRRLGIRERTYLAALLPRAAAKTNLITKATMMWLHLHDPNLSCYLGNEKRENAVDFLGVIKSHLGGGDEFSWWPWLYGSWQSSETRWRQDSIVHAARRSHRSEASFGIVSVGTGLTSKHPDIICLDDLVSYEGLEADADLFETAFAFTSSLIPAVEADGLIFVIGTRYGDGDPIGKLFASMGIKSVSGMQDEDYRATKNGSWVVYFLSGRTRAGVPAIPTVWSDAEMKRWEAMDPMKYAFQVLNRPSANPFRALREDEFDTYLVPKFPPKLVVTLHLDTAFRHPSRQAAYSRSAIVAMGRDLDQRGHQIFLGCWSSKLWDATQFSSEVIARCRSFEANGMRVRAISDEQVPGGKAGVFEAGLRADFARSKLRMPRFVTFTRQSGPNKAVRVNEAISMVRKGLVRFWSSAPGLADLRYELCSYPGGAHDDIADAFADSFHSDIYSAVLPYLTANPAPKEEHSGAWENELKPSRYLSGILDNYDREPIR